MNENQAIKAEFLNMVKNMQPNEALKILRSKYPNKYLTFYRYKRGQITGLSIREKTQPKSFAVPILPPGLSAKLNQQEEGPKRPIEDSDVSEPSTKKEPEPNEDKSIEVKPKPVATQSVSMATDEPAKPATTDQEIEVKTVPTPTQSVETSARPETEDKEVETINIENNEDKMKVIMQRLTATENALKDREAMVGNTQSQLEQSKMIINQLANEKRILENELIKNKSLLNSQDAQLDAMTSQLSMSNLANQNERALAAQQIRDIQSREQALTTKINELNTSLQYARSQHEALKATLNIQISELTAQNDNLKSMVQSLNEDKVRNQEALNSSLAKTQQMSDLKVSQLTNEYNNLIESLKNEAVNKDTKIAELTSQLAQESKQARDNAFKMPLHRSVHRPAEGNLETPNTTRNQTHPLKTSLPHAPSRVSSVGTSMTPSTPKSDGLPSYEPPSREIYLNTTTKPVTPPKTPMASENPIPANEFVYETPKGSYDNPVEIDGTPMSQSMAQDTIQMRELFTPTSPTEEQLTRVKERYPRLLDDFTENLFKNYINKKTTTAGFKTALLQTLFKRLRAKRDTRPYWKRTLLNYINQMGDINLPAKGLALLNASNDLTSLLDFLERQNTPTQEHRQEAFSTQFRPHGMSKKKFRIFNCRRLLDSI